MSRRLGTKMTRLESTRFADQKDDENQSAA
jgi:hypothetical protein